MTKEDLKQIFVAIFPDQSIGSYNSMMKLLMNSRKNAKVRGKSFTLGADRSIESIEEMIEIAESNFQFLISK